MTRTHRSEEAPPFALWSAVFAAGLAAQLVLALSGPFVARPALALAALLGAGAAWVAAVAAGARSPRLRWIVAGAICLRLVALTGDAELSDDVYRYAFEGGLVAEGLDPYGPAPAAPERAAVRERWPGVSAGVNHPEVRAAYPPGMQLAAAAVVAAAGGPEPPARSLLALRIAFGLCDLLCLLPLAGLARARGASVSRALLVWGWCPLPVLVFAGTGHFDALAILLLLLGLWALERPASRARDLFGGLALGLGATVKFLPLVALVGAADRSSRVVRVGAAAAVVAVGFGLLPTLLGWSNPLGGGLQDYGLRWEGGSALFRFVQPLFAPGGWFASDGPLPLAAAADGGLRDPRRLARLAVGALFALALLTLAVRRRDALLVSAWSLLAFVLLSPTLHPWYVTWALAPAALIPLRAPLWAAAAAPALYWPLVGWNAREEWVEPGWTWTCVLLPVLVLACVDAFRPRVER